MLLQAPCWSFFSGLRSHSLSHPGNRRIIISDDIYCRITRGKAKTYSSTKLVCASVGIDEIAEIVHNKVLIAAAVSAAIGQLSKPFTSAIIYGNRISFNFKSAFQAGGFPSTHSSAAVATAISLGLERGLSDAVFGLAVVYASLIMYDAQGVRREVGIHAKTLNRALLRNSIGSNDANDLIDSQTEKLSSNPESFQPLFSEEANPFQPNQTNAKLLLRSEARKSQRGMLVSSILSSDKTDIEGESDQVANSWALLKESVGHNEVEVVAGALLGFFVSLAVHAIT